MRSEAITIRVSENLKDEVTVKAKKEGRTVSNYIESIVKKHIQSPSKLEIKRFNEVKTTKIALKISPEFKSEISMCAAKENRTISNYIYLILQSEFGG